MWTWSSQKRDTKCSWRVVNPLCHPRISSEFQETSSKASRLLNKRQSWRTWRAGCRQLLPPSTTGPEGRWGRWIRFLLLPASLLQWNQETPRVNSTPNSANCLFYFCTLSISLTSSKDAIRLQRSHLVNVVKKQIEKPAVVCYSLLFSPALLTKWIQITLMDPHWKWPLDQQQWQMKVHLSVNKDLILFFRLIYFFFASEYTSACT